MAKDKVAQKPVISETKVERTIDKVQAKTKKATSSAYGPQMSYGPQPHPDTISFSTKPYGPQAEKTAVLNTKKVSSFLGKNRGRIAIGAVGFGLAQSWIDGEDDDVGSSAGKAVKAGVLTAGAAYGAEHLLKTQTIQSMVRGETNEISKSVRSKISKEAKMKAGYAKLGLAGKIGLGVVAAATVLDLGARGRERFESGQIQQAQEKQIIERKQRKQEKNKKSSYGNINDGEILFDLFDARSGHHKMGNAKFN